MGAVLLALALGTAAAPRLARPATPVPAPAPGSPAASWAEAMVAARAHCRAAAAQAPPSQAFDGGIIRGTDPARRVSVDLAGRRWLRLVTSVEEGAGNCHVWGDAKLVGPDGAETPLGTLKPASVRVGWGKLHVDRNWQGHPLRIGVRTFPRGIWVHGDSEVCYRLDPARHRRFDAWFGHDAARPQGAARFGVHLDAPRAPALWQTIKAKYPALCASFERDTAPNPLRWFEDAPAAARDRSLLGHALDALGPEGAVLRAETERLPTGNPGPDDARPLDLYARAARLRDCAEAIGTIPVADLHAGIKRRMTALAAAHVPPEDPRWESFRTQADAIAAKLADVTPTDLAALDRSILSFHRVLPERLPDAPAFRERVARMRARWRPIFDSLGAETGPELDWVSPLGDEIRALRRDLLHGLTGMDEFLRAPAHAGLEQEWELQRRALERDLANRAHFDMVAPETFRSASLILPGDRDATDVVMRRAGALLADLERAPGAGAALAWARRELDRLTGAGRAIDPEERDARALLCFDACRVRRRIAFANPLLDFDKILFVKRHRALFNHMCDQYYGMAAWPGGGLFVLCDPFGPAPRTRDLLAGTVVERGRLKGRTLAGGPPDAPPARFDGQGNRTGEDAPGGSFLAPDLSYDGRTILFAYVECTGETEHRHHTDPSRGHWAEGRCYHIFKVGADGAGLEQLTDGAWNDFDPCWLPNGRVAFISERRGGYLRCGRVCPTYTLYDMAADGRDIRCLSFHETNEWHPSVTHDGLIVWTRWDYVDRHGCTAHMPWVITPDGRDPRALHGNFAPRNLRPDMELDVRAIPGSHRLVGTAAPHHGQAYGSLVIIDPHVPDDDAMSPVRRLTPEVGFPESQGGAQVYGTPWPLSEDYHICVCDLAMTANVGSQGRALARGDYGIYLVDAFGNRELIHHDPDIGCLSPIPLRPRPAPPAMPDLAGRHPLDDPATRAAAPENTPVPEATVTVLDVYNGLKPWPQGTRIAALRVLQVLPMTVPSGTPPHNTGVRIALAQDSVPPARHVLGTAPVEKDGSARFVVPANREIFFQALDADGLAVQSMRSATQLRAGETLMCAGCHERRHSVPQRVGPAPLALRRPPSRLAPGVDGSNPFSYPRLVQPVLERHCAGCHREHRDRAPNLDREPMSGPWYASYASLTAKYGFTDYGDGYRTTPGAFGARASRLFDLLQRGHHGVSLPQDALHRIALWLDCASLFYGVYEKEGGEAQRRGEIVRPTLE